MALGVRLGLVFVACASVAARGGMGGRFRGGRVGNRCVAWRAVSECDGQGVRVPGLDRDCASVVPSGEAGFCECEEAGVGRESGSFAAQWGLSPLRLPCGHPNVTCATLCEAVAHPRCWFDGEQQRLRCVGESERAPAGCEVNLFDGGLECGAEEPSKSRGVLPVGRLGGVEEAMRELGTMEVETKAKLGLQVMEARVRVEDAMRDAVVMGVGHEMMLVASAAQAVVQGTEEEKESALELIRSMLERTKDRSLTALSSLRHDVAGIKHSLALLEAAKAREPWMDMLEETISTIASAPIDTFDSHTPTPPLTPPTTSPSHPDAPPPPFPRPPEAHGMGRCPAGVEFGLWVNGLWGLDVRELRQRRAEEVAQMRAVVPHLAVSILAPADDALFLRQEAVRRAFRHAWRGYERFAWGEDELQPVSRKGAEGLCKMGLTIIDSLSSLLLLSLPSEFLHAQEFVLQHIKLGGKKHDGMNVFETTIRVLASLLSTHELTTPTKAQQTETKTSTTKTTSTTTTTTTTSTGTEHSDSPSSTSSPSSPSSPPSPPSSPSSPPPPSSPFLSLAHRVASFLAPAFSSSPTAIPFGTVDFSSGKAYNPTFTAGASSISEAATLHLEFTKLARLTKEQKWEDWVLEIAQHLDDVAPQDSLFPILIDPRSGKLVEAPVSLGARGDSLYEYFAKSVLLFHRTDAKRSLRQRRFLLHRFNASLKGILDRLLQKSSPSNLFFLAEQKYPASVAQRKFQTKQEQDRRKKVVAREEKKRSGIDGVDENPTSKPMSSSEVRAPLVLKHDHLVCFFPGLIAQVLLEWEEEGGGAVELGFEEAWLGAEEGFFKGVQSREDVRSRLEEVARELTKTCFLAWNSTATGLAPEIWTFQQGRDFVPNHDAKHSFLRPETVESIFWMFKLTNDPIYREYGWTIFQNTERNARVFGGGYSGVKDVMIGATEGVQALHIRSMAQREAQKRRGEEEEVEEVEEDGGSGKGGGVAWEEHVAAQYRPGAIPDGATFQTHNLNDRMDSYYLAETLKYLYLLFSEHDAWDHTEFVLNTEAHPLQRIKD